MRTRAILLDAMGTLVSFRAPAPRLAASLGVPRDDAERAVRAEIAFYRAHHDRAGDRAGLAALRRDCARVVEDVLRTGRPLAEVEEALLAALRFEAFPEVPSALDDLRAAGCRLVVCSNWDVSLRDVLRDTGLAELVDGVVTSAEEGVAKPDPALFARALAVAGVGRADALHAGDSVAEDVEGARAAGIRPVLVARDGGPSPADVTVVTGLDALRALLD